MKRFLFFSFNLLICVYVSAQSKILRDSIYSETLNTYKHFSVYLPKDFDKNDKTFPVLYMLHGAGGNHTNWAQSGKLKETTDNAVNAGTALQMVIVMPDASGQDEKNKNMGYFNVKGWNYEDFFFAEFMPFVEKKYKIKSAKKYRSIGGLSMGGCGSIVYAQHKSEVFGSVCALSPRVQGAPDNDKYTNEYIQSLLHNEAVGFVEKASEQQIAMLKTIRWYVDCGDDDYLAEGNVNFYLAMKKNNIAIEYRMRNGSHTWLYWQTALPDVLTFVSIGFAEE